jgi:MFS family permease
MLPQALLTGAVTLGQVGASFATVRGRPSLRRAELAWAALIGTEWAHFVALGVFAYREGGTTAVGVAGVLRLLPAAVIAPYAAAVGDRFRRERFLSCIALVGAGALGASAVAASADARSVVFVAAAVVGVSSTLFRPALQALLPSVAQTPRELVAANGATSILESVGTLAGPVIAAALMSAFDVAAVFAVGALALCGSALLLARVTVEGDRVRGRATGSSVRQGLRGLTGVPGAATLVGLMVAQSFVRGCLNVLIVVAAFDVLTGGSAEVGYLTAAIGVGGIVGAIGGSTLDGRRLVSMFSFSLLFWGLPIAALGSSPQLAIAVLLMAVIGAANSIEDVTGFTLLQRVVPNSMLTAALGVFWGLAMAGTAIGSAVAPTAIAIAGTRSAFVIVAAVLPLLLLVAHRRLRAIEAGITPSAHLEMVEAVPVFAPLSLASKEQIAGTLVEVTAEPGDVVIRKGDVGDRCYLVADGSLSAEVDDTGTMRDAGAFFGEIALLRDIPRTATVRAVTHSRLYALHRDDFLAALSGHRPATAAATAIADAHLART